MQYTVFRYIDTTKLIKRRNTLVGIVSSTKKVNQHNGYSIKTQTPTSSSYGILKINQSICLSKNKTLTRNTTKYGNRNTKQKIIKNNSFEIWKKKLLRSLLRDTRK